MTAPMFTNEAQSAEAGRRFAPLAGRTFDLVIIGGGIIGCGIARDAALRGLRVALFEKEDWGYGTSSRSTRLIHGGLRYLEMLDFGLVRQDLREREILLRIAPHRVQPLSFLIPFYRRSWFYRVRLRAGMILYDLLSYDKSLPRHAMLSRAGTLEAEPGLNPDGLQGAARYWDAQAALPERLCLDNVVDAVEHGAVVFNHVIVTGLKRHESEPIAGRISGVIVRDNASGETAEVSAGIVVNAAGPWLDIVLTRFGKGANEEAETRKTGEKASGENATKRLRLTKGIHFAAPPAVRNALVLFSERDGRLFFAIPWLNLAWVGTTDTDFGGDLDQVRATGDDVRYLRESVRQALPDGDWNTIYYTNAGVRALVRKDEPNANESSVSRKHRLVIHAATDGMDGLLSVLGGKLTAYRDIAEKNRQRHFESATTTTVCRSPGAGRQIAPCAASHFHNCHPPASRRRLHRRGRIAGEGATRRERSRIERRASRSLCFPVWNALYGTACPRPRMF